ncbi:ATP-binding protein [Paenibacillus sp. CF384]|uniref:ATP-binding protein n=1 Tax=Paenibacillus sp. CF384 TaxID=1884382 RepID=UPI00089B6C3E|nr:ATP-binding protein [Paenibacillus sp. CF384]SDX71637.1 two-component system, OmpR family, sensor histidine kinase SaeS [Paenibacillus sp. CF384]
MRGRLGINAVPVASVPEGPRIRITVYDEGNGVPSGEEMKIFERFYRVDRSRSRESGGAGLGLSIAKLFTEEAGGTIGVEPNPSGEGSQFWFTLYQA